MATHPDVRRYAPATQRNRHPILAVLQQVVPPKATVLEISSGTGEHAAFFAGELPDRQWLPSDPDPVARASIDAWRSHVPHPNLHPPLALDVCEAPWPVESLEAMGPEGQDGTASFGLTRNPIRAIVNINMIHIAPWAACLGLMAGAGRVLPGGGVLVLYGPYQRGGRHTAPSNAAFDRSLRQQNPDWGVRPLEEVVDAAAAHSLQLEQVIDMPANNLSVVFRRME